jgi:hypothetical protein
VASFTVTVPDALIARLITAFRASNSGYAGMTDAEVAKAALRSYLRQVLADYEGEQARAKALAAEEAARSKAFTDTETIT